MRRNRLLIFASIAVLTAPGLASAATMFEVPAGATGTAHVVVRPGLEEEDHFVLKETYPASSAVDHYSRILQSWRPCTSPRSQWSVFGDVSGGKEQTIYELSRHWVNATDDTALILVLKYTSAGIKKRPHSNTNTNPDNDQQYVVLIRYKGKNASRQFSEMGLTCQKKK